jgi:membrane-associated phospholipid phosphatase
VNARPVELIVAGYGAIVTGVALRHLGDRPGAAWIATAHLLVIGLMLLLQRPLGRHGELIRDLVPVLLLFGLYGAIDGLNGGGLAPTHDRTIQAWEQALFGGQPARDWWQRWPSRVASAVFHAAYFSYYVIIPLPMVWLLARGRPLAARRAVTPIMIAFLGCYLAFLLAPVAGPYYEFARPPAWFLDNGPARLVYAVLAGGSSFGAAFPSSHVAGAWAAVLALASPAPVAALVLAAPATLLTIGVVYCQMHYALDAVAGVIVALAATAIAARLPERPKLGGSR